MENENIKNAIDFFGSNERLQPLSRSIEDLLFELTQEYCFVSEKLRKLNKAINADPASVSDKHKELWKAQAEYMSNYKEILALRIKDVLNNN